MRSQAVFGGVQCQGKRQQAQTETQRVPSKHQEKLIDCKGVCALVQVAQR